MEEWIYLCKNCGHGNDVSQYMKMEKESTEKQTRQDERENYLEELRQIKNRLNKYFNTWKLLYPDTATSNLDITYNDTFHVVEKVVGELINEKLKEMNKK